MHKGYNTIRKLIKGNQLHELKEIFEHIPKTRINKDLGIHYARFKNIITRVQGFKLEELYTLAYFTGVDERVFLDLAHNQYMAAKRRCKRFTSKQETV